MQLVVTYKRNLTRAGLTRANLTGANLFGADLTGAFLNTAQVSSTSSHSLQELVDAACADPSNPPKLPTGLRPPPPCAE
ncbi:MAG: pentapeptide repeat-containing protein [bacterium]|nr:pentapeptide repeat-containing protein [bacterium]